MKGGRVGNTKQNNLVNTDIDQPESHSIVIMDVSY